MRRAAEGVYVEKKRSRKADRAIHADRLAWPGPALIFGPTGAGEKCCAGQKGRRSTQAPNRGIRLRVRLAGPGKKAAPSLRAAAATGKKLEVSAHPKI